MRSLFAALALTPMLLATGTLAQTVTEDVNTQLWCGTAFVIFFSEMKPADVGEADAKLYLDGDLATLESEGRLVGGKCQSKVAMPKAPTMRTYDLRAPTF